MASNISIIEFLLALLFFVSFYLKMSNIEDFKYEIASYKLLPNRLLSAATFSVLVYELVLVIFFCLGLVPLIKASLAFFLLSFFTVVTIKKRQATATNTCACFGNITILNKYPVTRNILILGVVITNLCVENQIRMNLIFGIFLLFYIVLLLDVVQTLKKHKEYKVFYG